MPLLAPIAGIVSELGVREGAMLQAGTAAFTIVDLSAVWVLIEAPEAQSALLRPGLRAELRVAAAPQQVFDGRVDYVYPDVNAQTRTVKARVALANPGFALRPGMFADVTLVSAARNALTVPTEAVIRTGVRSVVIVMDGERFRAATVKTGAERGDFDDVILARKDAPASYHLACVVDDAASRVTMVVRGADLRASTPIQRLLQSLLKLPEPAYFHHPLVTHADGRRLAKRDLAPTLAALREAGADGRELAVDLLAAKLPLGFAFSRD